ncbi:MAG TPA: hypothetical protein PKW95_13270 [bacterium]|nr:hypothetical protein [bacterium]
MSHALKEIAGILATAIVRKRLRDVRNILKKNGKTEIGLEVSFGESLYPVEPEHEGERH